ncbi:chromate transporter [Flammeovirga yaeyamensis]|uniref:Chromate transporter n=1 Tax=Flammeovirga yaeyamensis TaxID=367791 RepID=A0AAX1N1I6_9BACT|nr:MULTISPECIES: chromate transporter [Flammeovirga]ANQ51358.2 chromate transporter [Flammeovirga sp. MY04]MBB3698412.1 chromate transporter [Flammeovirga yaeyamensis]NMF34237.1 chromate transporter [Flammeovirga yaeyamensis]QWG01221.1 chromate transporter [Flammeovirga yaeyamensis]
MIYLELFFSFFKVGMFTFGGGYAMVPLLEKELIDKKKWLTNDELLEIMSIAQMTPGTIAINAATFVGYREKGLLGGIMTTIGVMAPSYLVITIIYHLFNTSFEHPIAQKAFLGARACIVALIGHSVWKMFKGSITEKFGLSIFLGASILLFVFNIHPILLIILGAVTGILMLVTMPNQIKKLLK